MFGDMQSDLGRGGAALHVLPAAQRRGGQFRRRGTGTLPCARSYRESVKTVAIRRFSQTREAASAAGGGDGAD